MAIRRTGLDEMDRLFTEMRRAMFRDSPIGARYGRDAPHVSFESTDVGYVVVADLPGFDPDEIELRFGDDLLTIDAEHETSDDSDHDAGHVHSVRSRSVYEQIRVPETVLVDDITARYTNGVLEVHLPTEDHSEEEGTVIDIE
jgi:HSP20 family protein